jgi:hypothetical protein
MYIYKVSSNLLVMKMGEMHGCRANCVFGIVMGRADFPFYTGIPEDE